MFKGRMEKQNFGLSPPLNLPSTLGFPGAKSAKHFAWYRNTKMKSATLGLNTSPVEVTNISRYGFWLMLEDEELFLPFSNFPWFQDAAVRKILNVELQSSNHLYWPELDVDLAVESIRYPDRFPLVSKINA
jgi:hypothetical protein